MLNGDSMASNERLPEEIIVDNECIPYISPEQVTYYINKLDSSKA